MYTRTLLPICVISMSGSALYAQSAFDVSADGHSQINHRPMLMSHDLVTNAGSAVPFGSTPDQSVILRRQIGGLQIVDIDNDGNNDVVAVCYSSNSFPAYTDWHDMIFYGNGAGIDTAPGWISDIQTHTGDVQVGDVDGNGFADIVSIHGGLRRDTVRVYFGDAGGMPVVPGYVSDTTNTAWATSGVLADMNNDGDLDLVTTNQGVSPNPFRPIYMFENDGATLTTTAVWESADESIQNGIDARDLTGDGFPELAVAKWVNFNSGLYYNTTGTPDVFQSLFAVGTDADKGAAFTDLENDGIFEVGFGGDPSKVYTGVHGAFLEVYSSNPPFSGPQEIEFVDVDHDGDEDFVEVHFSDGKTHIYINNDGVLDTDPTWTYDASEVGTALAFGDLNNDSRTDMVVGYSGDTSIRVFFGQAPECPADINNDGELNFFDVSAFLSAFASQELIADFTNDGEWNFFDVSAFLNAFSAGCP